MVSSRLQLNHIGARNYLVQNGEWRLAQLLDHAVTLVSFGQLQFSFYLAKTFNECLHARRPQSFNQLVRRGLVRVCE
jgi:hypothetical protein